MEGFFKSNKINNPIKQGTCVTCGLYKTCQSPKMKAYGKFEKGILIIGEAPGKEEDRLNKQWQGDAGRMLKNILLDNDIKLFRDCICINAVNCRPPDNQTPNNAQINACRQRVWAVINRKQPKMILLMGNAAVQSFLGHRWKKGLGGVTKWRGWRIPDRDVNAWVCPTFHPSYINRMGGKNTPAFRIWQKDLKRALRYLGKPVPKFRETIEHLTDTKEIRSRLKGIWEWSNEIAFDYETTGLKPHSDGHKIICCSIAESPSLAISFPIQKGVTGMLKKILKTSRVAKMAHNIKFEHMWSKVILGVDINNWKWCSMQAAHVLDNRPGITGLKFQAYVRYGIVDYDSGIEHLLKAANQKDGNSINKIHKASMDEVLEYCGMDSVLGYRLAIDQMKELNIPFNDLII